MVKKKVAANSVEAYKDSPLKKKIISNYSKRVHTLEA
jgi:hypothetical protein